MNARTLFTKPSTEPITVADCKSHSNITIVGDNALLTTYIKAAREHVENIANRALITQTWDIFLDTFPAIIELPKSPLASVTSITYTDTNGDSQTLASSVYTVDTDSDPGRIYLAYQQSWPSIRSIRHAITVRFVAGYGVANAVPWSIKHAMLLLVGHWYENRELTTTLDLKNVPRAFNDLMAPYRIVKF